LEVLPRIHKPWGALYALGEGWVDSLGKYFSDTLGWGSGYQSRLVFAFLMEAAAEAGPGGVVLDAGAGHQRYKPFFAESIYLAQEHPVAGELNKGISEYDILSDVKTIPLQEGCVDLVLSTSSLEHIERPDEFFAEAHRVLVPGGALYVNVPFAYPEHEVPFDFQRPTRYGLRSYYERAGFERVSVQPSSSSTETAEFLLYAIREDSKAPGRSVAARAWMRFLRAAYRILYWLLRRTFDRGPRESSTFPVGWIAKGYKQGERQAEMRNRTKEEFISDSAELDSRTTLKDGRIRVEP
jgi:SAM-dependent methyltransferase